MAHSKMKHIFSQRMKTYKFIIALIAMASLATAGAQTASVTPYSRIGYGMLGENATGIQRQMGGVGYAAQNGRQINVMNPASYSQTDSITFLWDLGIDLTNVWSKEGDKSGYSFAGGLDYITSAFRLGKSVGASIGVVPFASVGYSFGSKIDGGAETRTGAGNISELYLGAGWEPLKNFSIGANVSYMFGNIQNFTYINNNSTNLFMRTLEVRDWNLHLGAQYGINLSKLDRVVLGVTYSPKKSLHGNTWGNYYDASNDKKLDTVAYTGLKGNFELPNTIGAGVSYNHGNKFYGEVNFTYQDWSKARYKPLQNFEPASIKFDNRWKVAAGLQYTPNSRGGYFKRMSYRMGAFYNHDYQNVRGNNVRDYGVGMGVGFPALGSKTLVNLGVEWKHRYTAPVKYITEDYLNITLSVTFNEMWFWKNKLR